MDVEVGKAHGALDRVRRRRRAGVAEAEGLPPAGLVRQMPVIVVSPRIAAHPRYRGGGDIVAPGKEMDLACARFQSRAGGVEGRGGRAEHRDGLAAQRGEVDDIRGVRAQMRGQGLQHRWQIRVAAAGDAIAEDDLAGGLDRLLAVDIEMQTQIIGGRFDPEQSRAVADLQAQRCAEPGKILGPVEAGDADEVGIGLLALAGLVPGLEAQAQHAELRPSQVLRCAQQVHPRFCQPDAGAGLVRGGVDDADPADAGALQGEGEGRAGMAAADDDDVMIDAVPLRDPVVGEGAEQAERFAGGGRR